MLAAMPSADAPADLVLTGGHVHTVDADRPRAEAIAVRGERIVAVGSAGEVAPLIGPRTRVADVTDRLVVPGFQDAHIHPISAGVYRLQCDVRESRGRDGVLATIRAYAESHPDEPWIVGSGWYMADFPNGVPRREDLDRVVPDRPAYLPNRDGHSAWVNTKALEVAGIDRETPDPPDGRIERDPDGTPSGALHEGAAELVERLLPAITDELLADGLREAQAYLHSLGITAWQDAIVTPRDQQVYRRAAEGGWLTARVEAAMWWERESGVEQIDGLLARSAGGSVGRLRSNSVKLMLDGVLETFTGAMLDPYLDADGKGDDRRGIAFIEPEVLNEAVVELDAAGLQPHFHAIGDRAVRASLDAVEAARRANGPSDTRPHIAHIQVIHPDDITRFRTLDVAANAQPYWACHEDQMDVLTIPFLGDRWKWQYPFRSLRAAGAVLAMGSDWSVSTPNPLLEMEVAVERVSDVSRGEAEPLLPDERIDLIDALAAFTSGSAYVNHLDADTGTLEVGKAADLAILDRDLFDRGTGAIGEARVVATLIDGAAVFEDPALDV